MKKIGFKKSQITLFIIIGVIVLLSAFLGFYLYSQSIKETSELNKVSETSLEITPIKNYVESCISSVGQDAIEAIGRKGGYHKSSNISIEDYYLRTAYYFFEGLNYMPSISKIENELSNYVNEKLLPCLNDFTEFKEMGFNIEQGLIQTKTIISENDISFEVHMPLNIKRGESIYNINSFYAKVSEIRLGIIYEITKQIVNKQIENPLAVCLTCLVELAEKNDLNIDMDRVGNSTLLFTIIDTSSKINNNDYRFYFANKYKEYSCFDNQLDFDEDFLKECATSEVQSKIQKMNYSFGLQKIPNINLTVNKSFVYQVKATGKNVIFEDYTHLFDIDVNSGLIEFVPDEEKIGNYTIWIKATDFLGNHDYQRFNIEIFNSK